MRHLFAFLLLFLPIPLSAAVLMTQDKALALAFPGGAPERKTLYLTPEQKDSVQKTARAKMESSLVVYYDGRLADGSSGRAFFETHIVRTMPEVFMTVVDAAGHIRFVELLAFYEPGDYQPPPKWLDQFKGRALDNELLVKRGIRNLTGATLTAQALTDGVRRSMALWNLIEQQNKRRDPQ